MSNDEKNYTDFLWQNPVENSSHIYKSIREHLRSPDIVRFRASVAYATWGGLSLIADDLEHFLENGKTLETIYGVENYVTTPDALLYSVYLQERYKNYENARVFPWTYIDSEFHQKYLEFEYPDHIIRIIGSNNLTRGGLAANHELAAVISSPLKSKESRVAEKGWLFYLKNSKKITTKIIRDLAGKNKSGEERSRVDLNIPIKKLGLKLPHGRKPLFQYILGDSQSGRRTILLANADTLSEKPKRLYLQILKSETGGGHQIQLPVETLGAFFGVAPGDNKIAIFEFSQYSDFSEVHLTHFGNNTHRVRLRPIKDVPRPAIVIFERTDDSSRYSCTVVSKGLYLNTLSKKCQQQTRSGSRRWGME